MAELSDNQQRHILALIRHVDRLLAEVEQTSLGRPSPFDDRLPDLSSEESRLLGAFIEDARGRMLRTLDRLRIPRPTPFVSSRWSALTTLGMADIALSELDGSALRGYGAIDGETAGEIQALVAELRDVVQRGRALLRTGG